eukprot:SAG31_NODE_476_length_15154_cov_24.796878_3_plen_238_part_00
MELLAIGDNVAPPAPPADPLAPIADDPSLPRVLLLGDSISIGYHTKVRSMLRGVANVHRPNTNGGHSGKGMDKLQEWLKAHGPRKWDVVHMNWGLHDLRMGGPDAANGASADPNAHQIDIEQYAKNLGNILDVLSRDRSSAEAKLIWCSTTPVPSPRTTKKDGGTMRIATDVPLYNAAAAEVMSRRGVLINDLYGFALPILSEIQKAADVHYTDEGSARLGEAVGSVLIRALESAKL